MDSIRKEGRKQVRENVIPIVDMFKRHVLTTILKYLKYVVNM